MGLAKVTSCALVGLDGEVVAVEVDVSQAQLPSFTIVGLPDAAVQEAKERVRTAIRNSDEGASHAGTWMKMWIHRTKVNAMVGQPGGDDGQAAMAGVPPRCTVRDDHGLIPQDAIHAVVRQIVERFNPDRIILFGSYAYGRPHAGSDVDVLVVMDTHLSELQQAARICQSLNFHFGLDLLVRTPANLTRRRLMGDPFVCDILDKGKILYERAHG